MPLGESAGLREKVALAHEHLHGLDRVVNEFVQGNDDPALGVEVDFDAGEWKMLCGTTPVAPLAWSALLGEFLYDLRSSLDHLARQLVVASGRDPERIKSTEFPVSKDKAHFEGRAQTYMGGMSGRIKARIKELQPYIEWRDHPTQTTLWRIHDMCNADKHRVLHLTDFLIKTVQVVVIAPPDVPVQHHPVPMPVRMEKDAVIHRLTWDPALMKAADPSYKVQMQHYVSFDVTLAEGDWVDDDGNSAPGGVGLQHLCGVMYDYVNRKLLPAFNEFVPWTPLGCTQGGHPSG